MRSCAASFADEYLSASVPSQVVLSDVAIGLGYLSRQAISRTRLERTGGKKKKSSHPELARWPLDQILADGAFKDFSCCSSYLVGRRVCEMHRPAEQARTQLDVTGAPGSSSLARIRTRVRWPTTAPAP